MTETSQLAAIDWQFVGRRRLEVGVSGIQVTAVLGFGPNTLRKCETGEYGGAVHLNLAAFLRLAELLACHPSELFTRPAEPDRTIEHAERLGAAMFASPTPLPSNALAEILALRGPQFTAVADELDARLQHCGLRLYRSTTWQIKDDPRSLAPAQRQRLHVHARKRRQLDRLLARLIYRMASRRGRQIRSDQRSNLPRLSTAVNAGIVTQDGTIFTLHGDVAFSLGLTSERPSASRSHAKTETRVFPLHAATDRDDETASVTRPAATGIA